MTVADSGTRRAQTFCSECGSPIHATSEDPEPKVYSLRLGTCAQRAELKPVAHIWCRSAMPWLDKLPTIPRRADQADVAP